MPTFDNQPAKTCNLCKKPKLYGGSHRCQCDDPIGFLPAFLSPSEAKIAGHLEYLLAELDSVAQEPPLTPEAAVEYLRGLEAYVKQVRALLPALDTQETPELELCA